VIDSWLAEPGPRYYDGDKTEIGSLNPTSPAVENFRLLLCA